MAENGDDGGSERTAEALCREARWLWLSTSTSPTCDGGTNNRMKRVEELYLTAWTSCQQREPTPSRKHHDGDDAENSTVEQENPFQNKTSRTPYSSACLDAGEKLAMLWLQSGQTTKADQILKQLGYSCRLASQVLNYPTSMTSGQQPEASSLALVPCRIFPDFVNEAEGTVLRAVFEDPFASYWKEHQYSVEPPSPYVSYLLKLRKQSIFSDGSSNDDVDDVENSFINHFVHRIRDHIATTWKPAVQQARYCEMWAHNRPHASGHQLHFDSDNEGAGGIIRNPILSTIVYLSKSGAGGPSLVTNQRLTSRSLADCGWLCHAVPNQLVAFNGKVLHGVIPGKPPASNHRRVTVMFAFWKDIQEHDNKEIHGAAKRFPRDVEWAQQLLQPWRRQQDSTATEGSTENTAYPIPLESVYEQVEGGKPWARSMGFPEYDQVFQGF